MFQLFLQLQWFLFQNEQCQRFQSFFTGCLCLCFAFGFVRQVNIFQFNEGHGIIQFLLKDFGHFTLFRNGFLDGCFSFGKCFQYFGFILNLLNDHFIQGTGFIFSDSAQ